MKQSSAVFFACFFFVAAVFGLGKSDGKTGTGQVKKASVTKEAEARILAAYIVDDDSTGIRSPSEKLYAEGMYLPQAAGAYFGTPFSFTAKERRLGFDGDLPFRVLSESALGSGVRVYTIEARAPGERAGYADGRSYSFSFPRAALGKEGSVALQPAPYALERAIRLSSIEKGLARLESLRYDEATSIFKASVFIAPQSSASSSAKPSAQSIKK